MQCRINPEGTLEELDYGVLRRITDVIGGDWRRFVGVIPGYSVYDVEEFAAAYRMDEKPAMRILMDLIRQGKTIRHLISYLEKVKLESALVLLKEPETLRLTKEPEDGTFVEDTQMRLECNATGFPFPRYQWFHVYLTKDNIQFHQKLSEGTEKVLCIDQVKREQCGGYYCQVYHFPTPDGRKVLMQTVPVLVQINPSPENTEGERPVITKQPKPMTVVKGKPVVLECRASGRPEPKYMWYKRGHDNKKLKIKEEIKWDQASPKDAGIYSCRVWNRCGEVWSNEVMVTVAERKSVDKDIVIKIERQPVDSDCLIGEKHRLECQAVCKLPLFYQWYKGDEQGKLPGCNESKLTFDPVKAEDEGRYFCKIWNESGCNQQSNFVQLSLKSSVVNSIPGKGYFATDKIALLIGNMTYRGSEALSAVNHDVSLLQEILLLELGFKCLSFMNLDKDDMERAVDLFCDLITPNSYVVFYFSGHGFQHMHRTYMVPIDAQIGYMSSECICVQDVHRKIQLMEPALNNMNLDICRCVNENERGPPNTTMDNTVLGNSVIFCASNVGTRSEALESVGTDGRRPKGIFTDYLTKRIVQKEDLRRIMQQVQMDVATDPQVTNRQYPEVQTDLRFPLTLHDPIKNQSRKAQQNAEEFWYPLYRCGDTKPFSIENVNFELVWRWTFSNVIRVEVKNDAGYNLDPKITVIPESLCVTDLSDRDMLFNPRLQSSGASLSKEEMKVAFKEQELKDNSTCSVWHISNVQKATKPLEVIIGVMINNKLHRRKILFPPNMVILEKWNSCRRAPVSVEKDFRDSSSGEYSSTMSSPPSRTLETMSMNNCQQ